MKTRFLITDEIFSFDNNIEECFKFYNQLYEKLGFILDRKRQAVYKDFDREIDLNEGDRVGLSGFRIVEWKCVDLDNNMVIYYLREE